jgi:soluble lytic murein transglycosylase-like protein
MAGVRALASAESMFRLVPMLLLGTLALSPAAAGAGDNYACKDADGVWVLGNAGRDRCVTKITRINMRQSRMPGPPPTAAARAKTYAEARAIILAPTAYLDHIRRAAETYKLPEELLQAVMSVESGNNPVAMSNKGAAGLMQLMPDTAKDMYVRDVWNPSQNIDGGARYLRILANQYEGDLTKTLAAYNAGPEAVRRAGGVPSYQETRDYIRKVLGVYDQLKQMKASGVTSGQRRDG